MCHMLRQNMHWVHRQLGQLANQKYSNSHAIFLSTCPVSWQMHHGGVPRLGNIPIKMAKVKARHGLSMVL